MNKICAHLLHVIHVLSNIRDFWPSEEWTLKSNITRMLGKKMFKQNMTKILFKYPLFLAVNGNIEQFNCFEIGFNILANTYIFRESSFSLAVCVYSSKYVVPKKFSLLSHRLLYTLLLLPHQTADNFAIKSAYSVQLKYTRIFSVQ